MTALWNVKVAALLVCTNSNGTVFVVRQQHESYGMAKAEVFEKGASIECNIDWWPKFQVVLMEFPHKIRRPVSLTLSHCFADGKRQIHLKTIQPKSHLLVLWEIVFGNCDRAKMICFIVFLVNWSMTKQMTCEIITIKCAWKFQSLSIKRSQTKNPKSLLPMNRSFVMASIITNQYWKHIFDWTSIWMNATPNGRMHIRISKVRRANSTAFVYWTRIPWKIYSRSYAAKIIIYRGTYRFFPIYPFLN